MRYIYMAVTKDKYELPLAVADRPAELAQCAVAAGHSVRSIYDKAARQDSMKNVRVLKSDIKFVRVRI